MMIISEIILLIYDHLHAIDSPKKIFSKAPIIPCINRICQYQWIWLHEFNTLCFCNSYSPSPFFKLLLSWPELCLHSQIQLLRSTYICSADSLSILM